MDVWDYCTITFRIYTNVGGGEHGGLNYGLLWFEAEARGPNGRYTSGKSAEIPFHRLSEAYPESRNSAHVALHQGLVQSLVAQGWQPVSGGGSAWWEKRFRRKSYLKKLSWGRSFLDQLLKSIKRKRQ